MTQCFSRKECSVLLAVIVNINFSHCMYLRLMLFFPVFHSLGKAVVSLWSRLWKKAPGKRRTWTVNSTNTRVKIKHVTRNFFFCVWCTLFFSFFICSAVLLEMSVTQAKCNRNEFKEQRLRSKRACWYKLYTMLYCSEYTVDTQLYRPTLHCRMSFHFTITALAISKIHSSFILSQHTHTTHTHYTHTLHTHTLTQTHTGICS